MSEESNEELVRKLMGLTARIEELAAHATEIKDILRERAGDGTGVQTYGDLQLRVTANRRFNATKAQKVLPATLYDRITETVPSSKKMRQLRDEGVISEEQYNAVMDDHPARIGVGFRRSEEDE